MVQPMKQAHRRFYLSHGFVEAYKDRQPNWGPAGYLTYKTRYARRKEDGSTEEYWETVKRVVEGVFDLQKQHIIQNDLTWDDGRAQKTAKEMYDAMWEFKFLPPGRGLFMMGTDYIRNRTGAGLFNCAFISTEDINTRGPEIYEFIMDALMLGVGVGFDTLGADKTKVKAPKETNGLVFIIPDSREGWVESVGMILHGFFEGVAIPRFDYSEIRAAGEPIEGFGGTASGPEPLKELHNELTDFFLDRIGEPVTAVDIVDIENFISKCVVAGNVRRSAALALGDPFDMAYIGMKHDQEKLDSHRHQSNNSVACGIGMSYEHLAENTKRQGEPGYQWLENARSFKRTGDKSDPDKFVRGTNPCGEIFLESGELCNLAEIFPAYHDSYEDFERTLKLAYLYCKSVTLTKTHWPETNARMLKNRRIGLGLGGIIQAQNKHGIREILDWCDMGYNHIQELDEQFSNWLAIPRSKRTTTVKPSGTVSLLNGATPGVHFPHSEYYLRRITLSKSSPLLERVVAAGYPVRDYHYDPERTVVIDVPVKEPLFRKSKREASMWEQIENTAKLQRYWADNAVSNTITVKDEEKDQIEIALQHYEDQLKSASFMPLDDHGYTDAPYEEIDQETYEEIASQIGELDFTGVIFENGTKSLEKEYCDSESCEVRR